MKYDKMLLTPWQVNDSAAAKMVQIGDLRCSADAFNLVGPILADLSYEEFWIILCSRSNTVISSAKISQGGISGTVTDVRLILNAAVEKLASGIIRS
ncbi:MAG: JAB domain-containing protein [Bacteroidales bacterium]